MKKIFTTLALTAVASMAMSQSAVNVLLEDGTGTWCGWCTGATVIIEDLEAEHNEVFIPMAIHSGDPMEITEGDQLLTFFNQTSYPGGMINRTLFSGESKVPITRSAWAGYVADEINTTAPLEVEVLHSAIDLVTNEIYVRANVNVTGTITKELVRVHLFLLQDGVISSSAQANYYANNPSFPSHPMFSRPSSISDFVHNDVFRATPTGTYGMENALSTTEDATPFLWRFQPPANMDGGLDHENMKVVVFATFYDAGGSAGNEVINAQEAHLASYNSLNPKDPNHPENKDVWGVTGVEDLIAPEITMNVGPNPISDLGIATFNLPTDEYVTVELFNLFGQKVQTLMARDLASDQEQRVAINGHSLANGMYILTLTAGDQVVTERIVISN